MVLVIPTMILFLLASSIDDVKIHICGHTIFMKFLILIFGVKGSLKELQEYFGIKKEYIIKVECLMFFFLTATGFKIVSILQKYQNHVRKMFPFCTP